MSSIFSKMIRAEDYFSSLHSTELLQGLKEPTKMDKIAHPLYARDLDQGKRMLNRCVELVKSDPKVIEISDGMKEPFMDYLLYLIDKGHTHEFNGAFNKLDFKDAELLFNKICKCSDPGKYVNRISVPIESFIKKNSLNEQMLWAGECVNKLSEGKVKEGMKKLLAANPKLIYLFNTDRKEFTRIFKEASVAKQLSFFKFYVENRNAEVNREVERRNNKLIDLSWLKIGRSEDNFSPGSEGRHDHKARASVGCGRAGYCCGRRRRAVVSFSTQAECRPWLSVRGFDIVIHRCGQG